MSKKLVLVGFALLAVWLNASAQEPRDNLYTAIRSNDLQRLKALLDEGVSANTEGPNKITPLMDAAAIGSVDAMKMLIERRADVNAVNTYGSTALMWSVTDAKKVRLLLDNGADVNVAAKITPERSAFSFIEGPSFQWPRRNTRRPKRSGKSRARSQSALRSRGKHHPVGHDVFQVSAKLARAVIA